MNPTLQCSNQLTIRAGECAHLGRMDCKRVEATTACVRLGSTQRLPSKSCRIARQTQSRDISFQKGQSIVGGSQSKSKVQMSIENANATTDRSSSETLVHQEDAPDSQTSAATTERYYHPNLWGTEVVSKLGGHDKIFSDDETVNALIEELRTKFSSLSDEEISPSAYDTAWVARVPALDGSAGPQFPDTIKWIAEHQLQDGSWGEESCFWIYDRIVNTLASLIALKTWDAGQENIFQGIEFLRKNIEKLEKFEPSSNATCDYELLITALLKDARRLGLQLPYESQLFKEIEKAGAEKLDRFSAEKLCSHPSSLLYSLECFESLVDWEKVMKLQSKDGSFLGSPSATAFALIHTKDPKCLEFLNSALSKFNSEAVPCHHPFDLSHRLRLVDTIDRMGISRIFEEEIKTLLDHVYRSWTSSQGVGWSTELSVPNLADTATAFRLLRLYGYDVTPEVFEIFKQDGRFTCYPGEEYQGLSAIISLYRASQLRFPGESLLKEAYLYTRQYLEDAIKSQAHEEWSLKRDLPGEIKHALKFSWHRTLPRVETRVFMDFYGTNDAWLGKTLYRLPLVNNEKLLAVAKSDFNKCQAYEQQEIQELSRWYDESGLAELPYFRQRPVESYLSPAAALFEPKFALARLVFAKATILVVALDDLADTRGRPIEELYTYLEAVRRWDPSMVSSLSEDIRVVFMALYNNANEWIEEASRLHGRDLGDYLRKGWANLIQSQVTEAEWAATNTTPTLQEYLDNGIISVTNGTIALNTFQFCGDYLPDDLLAQVDYRSKFLRLMNQACRLINDSQTFKAEKALGEQATAVFAYMRDHPGASEDESLAYLFGLNEDTLVELNYEFLRKDNGAPTSCKRLIYDGLARSMQMFYIDRDGFSDADQDIKRIIKSVLMEPVA